MRYRIPEDCGAVSHQGRELEIAPDGTLDLDACDAASLAPHGLVVADNEDQPGGGKGGRPDKRKPGSDS